MQGLNLDAPEPDRVTVDASRIPAEIKAALSGSDVESGAPSMLLGDPTRVGFAGAVDGGTG